MLSSLDFLIRFNSEILYSCTDKLENVLDVLEGLQAGLSEVQESFLEMQVLHLMSRLQSTQIILTIR